MIVFILIFLIHNINKVCELSFSLLLIKLNIFVSLVFLNVTLTMKTFIREDGHNLEVMLLQLN